MTTKITKENITSGTISSTEIENSTITDADVSPSAAIAGTKLSGVATDATINPVKDNVGLLGFKIAVNEGLTVFNLQDGIVDEFRDITGLDPVGSSNMNPVAAAPGLSDYIVNDDSPAGVPVAALSAGFSTTTITEPDTSVTHTNGTLGTLGSGNFITPDNVSSLTAKVWGAGASRGGHHNTAGLGGGGGGGFADGIISTTPGESFAIYVGEGGGPAGDNPPQPEQASGWGNNPNRGGTDGAGQAPAGGKGGGLSAIATAAAPGASQSILPGNAPNYFMIAGGGGGGASNPSSNTAGGAGGGNTGQDGQGEGGSQTAGGTGAQAGGFLFGGDGNTGGAGGSGYYGGGGSTGDSNQRATGGGGSGYIGNPEVSSATNEQGSSTQGAGATDPDNVAGTNEGSPPGPGQGPSSGEDGYVLLTFAGATASTRSTTIQSDAFTASTAPSSARVVVFEEDVDTPTLNTDIIVSVSRDNGTTFTAATMSDVGYVVGSSGQRILTGTVDVSGQPSGTSMKYKIALANNTVKVHGVALQWS